MWVLKSWRKKTESLKNIIILKEVNVNHMSVTAITGKAKERDLEDEGKIKSRKEINEKIKDTERKTQSTRETIQPYHER